MEKELIIIDSCVFIKAFRKEKKSIELLKELSDRISFSVITYLELLAGANTREKKIAIKQIFDSYYGIPLSPSISSTAADIMYEYISGQRNITVPDCLIAATSIVTGFPLLTYNKKDFDFIDGIHFH